MNTTAGLWIGGIILAIFLADAVYFQTELWVFLFKKLVDLMHWLAFWR
ncbi:MAG: hypothetical protein AAGJ96_01570 [Pseudomonadota bacterium]